MISSMQRGWGRDDDEVTLAEDLSGQALCCQCVLSFLLFFNPSISLDSWEN